MGFGGRVVDYFEEHIQDKDAVFVFPEFLPEDCPSKKLCNAEIGELVEINGNIYVKKCTTIQLEGCSGHGYFKEKLKVIKRYPNVKAIMLNHGDRDSIWDLKQTLPQYTEAKILEPEYNDTYDLTKMLEKIKK